MIAAQTDAVTCHRCNSNQNVFCNDPFVKELLIGDNNVCTGAACTKKNIKLSSGKMGAARDCSDDDRDTATNVCASVTVDGVKVNDCVCGSDYCNDSDAKRPYHLMSIIFLAVAATII